MQPLIRDFKIGDIKAMDIQDMQRSIMSEGMVAEYESCWDSQTYSFTVEAEEGIIFCGGVAEFHSGVGTAWAVISKHFAKYSLFLTKATKRLLDHVQYNNHFHRIEVTARVNFPQAERWIKLLGFEYEGLREAFDVDKTDHVVYRRVSRE